MRCLSFYVRQWSIPQSISKSLQLGPSFATCRHISIYILIVYYKSLFWLCPFKITNALLWHFQKVQSWGSRKCAWRLGTQASLHYLWVWDAKFASRICKGCCAKKFGYITYIFFQKCHIIISQLTDLAISKANSNFLAKI